LERELAAVGLRVKKITADGNCFFRSVCDQMEVRSNACTTWTTCQQHIRIHPAVAHKGSHSAADSSWLVLQGTEHGHADLRARVVAFMHDNEADFAPFVEDDQSFSAYIARMKKVSRAACRQPTGQPTDSQQQLVRR
jgi:OTU domain-containing protein 3